MEELDELSEYLKAVDRYECYRVAEEIKRSPSEITEKVYLLVGENKVEFGPYIRKCITNTKDSAATTNAYSELFQAQKQGKRFQYLPRIIDFFPYGTDQIVIMEYVQGRTLQKLIELEGSIELVKQIFPILCDAVTELHESFSTPIIHRDLKPANIIINNGGVTIIDLGISRKYREDATTDTQHLGTPGYAAPEQFGYSQTTIRSDIYSLGAILYSCITRTNPTSVEIDKLQQGNNTFSIPTPLARVISKASSFNPADRYNSARSLKEAFLQAITELETLPLAAPNNKYAPINEQFSNSAFFANSQASTIPAATTGMPPTGASSNFPFVTPPNSPSNFPPNWPSNSSLDTSYPENQQWFTNQPNLNATKITPATNPQLFNQQPSTSTYNNNINTNGYNNTYSNNYSTNDTNSTNNNNANNYHVDKHDTNSYNIDNQNTYANNNNNGKVLSVTEFLGLIWNVTLLLLWILLLFVTVDLVFNPTEEQANAPFLANLSLYLGIFVIFSIVFYAVLDKRLLRRQIPFMRNRTWKNDLLLSAILFVAAIILAFAGALFTPTT